ncbi:phosphoprotein phosphatase [Emticicia sp. CRIBPO]|uniref:NIF family HAD-type phosphatase n=1 Tax=Emticicia sp. CRIBPO TaxID=2683258 RepID=UPI001412B9FD|nr:HAD family hydrolase [Emticicia sp. CRIBPO]NBA88962.1 phosphoprotein phosphatase [Emticicia sp. CRIBPO]
MEEKSDKLLILDLDETLIHATENKLDISEDFLFDKYFVYKRPFLDKFLSDISRHFTIGIWSSADDNYVTEIVKSIKPDNVELEVIWGRSRCSVRRDYDLDNYYFEKRLHKLKNRGFRLEQIIIVDDTPAKSKSNYGNAIYIREFSGEATDEELKHLHDYLLTLKTVVNVREIEKRGWRSDKEAS